MYSSAKSTDSDHEIFVQKSNDKSSRICPLTTDIALLSHDFSFLGEGDVFTIGNIFQPGERVEVKILHIFYTASDNSSAVRTQALNQTIRYEISLHHGACNWKIYRTRAELGIFDRAIREAWSKFRVKQMGRRFIQDRLHERHDHRPKINGMEQDKEKIGEYLTSVINRIEIHCLNAVLGFFEISPLTFCTCLGTSKFKEGEVQLLPKSRIRMALGSDDKFGKKRWIILKDSYLIVLKPHKIDQEGTEDESISFDSDSDEENESRRRGRRRKSGHGWYHYRRWRFCKVLLMDQGFDRETKNIGRMEFLQVRNLHSQITFAPSIFGKVSDWMLALKAVQSTNEAKDYIEPNEHGSFAPMRSGSQMLVGIDGAVYMAAVADAMEKAQHEIFITDWYLSPEIYLKRPCFDDKWRLDKLLERKADQGVRICILIYREVKLLMNMNSRYTKEKLTSLHKNIHVIRHPSHIKDHTLYWSHHEKMVVVDQSVVFIGGIDLCYGRWDVPDHPILDLAIQSASLEVTDSAYLSLSTAFLPIRDASSDWLSHKVAHLIDINRCIRSDCLPSHGRSRSLNRFSRKRHNRDSNITEADESVVFSDDDIASQRCSSGPKEIESNAPHQKDYCLSAQAPNPIDKPTKPDPGQFLFPGMDYVNLVYKDLSEVHKPEQSYINRNTVPRMPWHDVGVALNGKIVCDFSRHFIQRWNAHRKRKAKHERKRLSISQIPPVLIPMEPTNPNLAAHLYGLGGGGSCWSSLNSAQTSLKTQALRSVGHWSLASARYAKANTVTGGKDTDVKTEHSIQNAYVEAIESAENFIYIENQFFISLMQDPGSSPRVQNKITQAIYDRVVRAHSEKKPFRVYILIPLLPAFEGTPGDKRAGINIHTILHYTQQSLFKGKTALLPRLRLVVGDVDNYVSICGLRNYQQWPNGHFVTEQVYIHDKIIIVDDRKLIIGSANINDRSLLGDRDSELGLYVEEIPSPQSKVGEGVIAKMRTRLMAEHLGVFCIDQSEPLFWGPELLLDPVSDEFYHRVWRKSARYNMKIFDRVFGCSPSDDIREYQTNPPPIHGCQPCGTKFAAMLRKVRGHLCEYPQDYLAEADLTSPRIAKERLASEDMWI